MDSNLTNPDIKSNHNSEQSLVNMSVNDIEKLFNEKNNIYEYDRFVDRLNDFAINYVEPIGEQVGNPSDIDQSPKLINRLTELKKKFRKNN